MANKVSFRTHYNKKKGITAFAELVHDKLTAHGSRDFTAKVIEDILFYDMGVLNDNASTIQVYHESEASYLFQYEGRSLLVKFTPFEEWEEDND